MNQNAPVRCQEPTGSSGFPLAACYLAQMAIKMPVLIAQAGLVKDAQAAFPCGTITAHLPARLSLCCWQRGLPRVRWPFETVVHTKSHCSPEGLG